MKQLSVSDGNNGLMTNKCCYFVRNVPHGAPLDTGVAGGSDLLFGEVGDSPLNTIESMLSHTYAPMITTYDNWGKADEEQRTDFVNEIESFTKNISEALSSFETCRSWGKPRKARCKSSSKARPSSQLRLFRLRV